VMDRSPDEVIAALLRDAKDDPAAHRPSGALHTAGTFLHLVRDPMSGQYLAPSYIGLEEQIEAAHRRILEVRELPGGADLPVEGLNLQPYPTPVMGPISWGFRSDRIAIIDSGVLPQHPLVTSAIAEVHDVTGEGIEDRNGHGTIQAIRHHWVEPRARLVIVKAFAGLQARPTVWTLLKALEYVRQADVGYVFMAGGVDQASDPGACRICEMADAVCEAVGLKDEAFVATRGNMGSEGRWCPAEAEHVTGIVVIDSDTMKPGYGPAGGFGVTQKGPYASFPTIEPLPLGDFYVRYAGLFREAGALDLAREYAECAIEHPPVRVEALRSLAQVALAAGLPSVAVGRLREAVRLAPDIGDLHAELGATLILADEPEEGRRESEEALRRGCDSSMVQHNLATLLEREGQSRAALDRYELAASADPAKIGFLHGVGARAFYGGRYADAIEVALVAAELDPTCALAHFQAAIGHALGGDDERARSGLERYATLSEGLDSSVAVEDIEATRAILATDDVLARKARLAWTADDQRGLAREYAQLAELADLESDEIHRRLAALGGQARRQLGIAAGSFAERLLRRPRGAPHELLVHVVEQLAGSLGPEPTPVEAVAWGSLGLLHHRCGRLPAAAAALERAATVWGEFDARRCEESLVAQAFAHLTAMEDDLAEAALDAARATSMHITDSGLTALTPRLLNGYLELALRANAPETANEHLHGAYQGEANRAETLLQHARLLIAQGEPSGADKLVWPAIALALDDPVQLVALRRLLEDHPFHDFVVPDGGTVRERLEAAVSARRAREVRLVNAAAAPGMPATGKGADPARSDAPPLRVAVVGTGLRGDLPALQASVVAGIDLTGEGRGDGHGSGSRRAVRLAERVHDAGRQSLELLEVKVLDRFGTGEVAAFLHGLLWAAANGAQMAVTDAQIDRQDVHLHGLLDRAASAMTLVCAPPDSGHGEGFPGLISGRVLREPAP
jgi:tetratricopeptide (TPR) repeat protein